MVMMTDAMMMMMTTAMTCKTAVLAFLDRLGKLTVLTMTPFLPYTLALVTKARKVDVLIMIDFKACNPEHCLQSPQCTMNCLTITHMRQAPGIGDNSAIKFERVYTAIIDLSHMAAPLTDEGGQKTRKSNRE